MKVRDSNVLMWIWGQRKMSQVLGMFGLLFFTMLWLVSNIFSGCVKPWITETMDAE
jgi:hypothetical protein